MSENWWDSKTDFNTNSNVPIENNSQSWDWNYDNEVNNMLSNGSGSGANLNVGEDNSYDGLLGMSKGTTDGISAFGAAAQGASSLWSGYLSYLNYKSAEKQQKVANEQWDANYGAARTALNRKYAINDAYNKGSGGYVEGSRIAEANIS